MSVPSNLIPTRITQLPDAPSADPDGLLVYVLNGVTYKIDAGSLLQVAGVPTSRQVIAGTGMTGGGALSSDVTLSIANGGVGTTQLASSGVTPGTYGSASAIPIVTVDATGRVTAASTTAFSVSGYVTTSTQVIAGDGLTGGGALNANVTLSADLSDALPGVVSDTGIAGIATSVSRSDHQHPAIDLADDTQVNGLLGLDNGGTARSLVPAAGAPVWSGADGLYIGTVGLAGQVYVSGGTGAPTWGSVITVSDQSANVVYAGPASGPDAPTAFRALVNADLPTVDIAHGGTGATDAATALSNLGAYPDTNPDGFMVNPMTTAGDVVYGGVSGAPARLAIGGANTVLHGGASSPSYSPVVEADISLSNNSTNNVSTTRHGFAPILPDNPALYLDGQGNYTIPSGLTVSASYSATAFSGQTSVNVVHNFGAYPLVQVVDGSGIQFIPLSVTNNTLNDFTVVFSTSTSGTIMASVGSPQPQALTVTANNYTVLTTDRIVKVTASGKTVTLPTSVGNTGREFIINNASPGSVTVATTSSQTISAQLTQTLPAYSSMTVYSDGANYWII